MRRLLFIKKDENKVMLTLITLAVLMVLVGAFVAQGALSRHEQQSHNVLYTKQQHLFSPAELSLMKVLDEAVSDQYRVFGKVRVADVLEVKSGVDKRDRRAALNRITSKHFDYVLCRKDDLSFVCAIELDDRSHERAERRERDQFLDETWASRSSIDTHSSTRILFNPDRSHASLGSTRRRAGAGNTACEYLAEARTSDACHEQISQAFA